MKLKNEVAAAKSQLEAAKKGGATASSSNDQGLKQRDDQIK